VHPGDAPDVEREPGVREHQAHQTPIAELADEAPVGVIATGHRAAVVVHVELLPAAVGEPGCSRDERAAVAVEAGGCKLHP